MSAAQTTRLDWVDAAKGLGTGVAAFSEVKTASTAASIRAASGWPIVMAEEAARSTKAWP